MAGKQGTVNHDFPTRALSEPAQIVEERLADV